MSNVQKSATPSADPGIYQLSSSTSFSKQSDSTPEKPIMNDSGVDMISPQPILSVSSSSSSSAALTPPSYSTAYTTATANPAITKRNQVVEETEDDDDDDTDNESDDDQAAEDELKENKEEKKLAAAAVVVATKRGETSMKPAKPSKSYLEIISNAILSSPVRTHIL